MEYKDLISRAFRDVVDGVYRMIESDLGVSFDRILSLVKADLTLGRQVTDKKRSFTGTAEEIAINSDGISVYIRSGGGGFYLGIDEIEYADGGTD